MKKYQSIAHDLWSVYVRAGGDACIDALKRASDVERRGVLKYWHAKDVDDLLTVFARELNRGSAFSRR